MSDGYPTCTCADPKGGHSERCPTLRHPFNPDGSPKIAPVQGWKAGIPWSLHLEAYSAYERKYSAQAALIDLDRRGCRGGFGTEELDDFIPGWRDRVSEITSLREEVKMLSARVTELSAENDRLSTAVCGEILGDLLSADEAAALADFVKFLRAGKAS